VEGSARFANGYNGGTAHVISNPTENDGALIGYEKIDGEIPGCTEYSGWVTFCVVANFDKSDYSLESALRFEGQSADDWGQQLDVKDGDIVNVKLVYTHKGNGRQYNVVLKDVLPKGLEYIDGTTKIKNATHPELEMIAEGIASAGLNIGAYSGDSNAIIVFSAKVTRSDLQTITNSAEVITENDGVKFSLNDLTLIE
jgi:uncharacterized repeat protein (TIGR01451 family)